MDARKCQSPSPFKRAERGRNEFAGWCENNRSVQFVWRKVAYPSDPFRAQFSRESLMLKLEGADVDFTAPMERDLDGDVGGGAKPVQAETLTRLDSTHSECPVADNASAEQRSGFVIRKDRWNWVGKLRRDNCVLGIPAIDLVTGEPGLFAEILAFTETKFTSPTCALQPCDADTITDLDSANSSSHLADDPDSLMARNQWSPHVRQFSFNDMDIRPTDAANADPDQHLARSRNRYRHVTQLERVCRDIRLLTENHRLHGPFTSWLVYSGLKEEAGHCPAWWNSAGLGTWLRGFCLNAFDIESDLYLVPDHKPTVVERFVPDHSEVLAIEFSLGIEAGPHIAPRVFRGPVEVPT